MESIAGEAGIPGEEITRVRSYVDLRERDDDVMAYDTQRKLHFEESMDEERIQDIYDRYNSKPENKRGGKWQKEMRHRQRQHRASLESIYLTLEQVLTCLPTAGPNGGLRQKLRGYMKRLQPHADNKSKGDRTRLLGNSRKQKYGAVA